MRIRTKLGLGLAAVGKACERRKPFSSRAPCAEPRRRGSEHAGRVGSPYYRVLILLFVAMLEAHAAEIVWTNTVSGNWNVATNWSPNQAPGASDNAYITNNGTYTVTVNTAITISGLTLGGTSGTQTLAITTQTLTLNGSSTVSGSGVLSMTAGTLTGTGNLSVSSRFNWSAGTHSGSGLTTIAASGVLTMGSVSTKALSGRTLVNAGTATWSGGFFTLVGGALFTNAPSGTFDITFAGTVNTDVSGSVIANAGLLRKTAGTGASDISPAFNSSGTVEVQSGTLSLNGNGTNSGSFSVSSGATLDLSSSGIIAMDPGSSISCLGNFTVSRGTANLAGLVNVTGTSRFSLGTANFTGTYTITGPLVLSGALTTANFNGSGTITPTVLDLLGGILGGTNAVIVSGPINWTAGDFAGANSVIANGGLILDSNGTKDLAGRTLINAGPAAWNDGAFRIGGGALFTNAPSGTFDITFAGTVSSFPGGAVIANAGLFRKTASTNAANVSSVPFNNTGTVEIQAGTLSIKFDAVYTQTAGLTLLNGGNFSSTQPIRINGGTLAGNGVVTGTVTNGSVVSPGASPGSLTIVGNYFQTAGGALDIELAGPPAGTNYDRVVVTSTATLDGWLNVRLTNAYVPLLTNRFQVLACGARNGTFASFSADPLGSTNYLNVAYSPTAVEVYITNAIPWFTKLQSLQPSRLFQIQIAGVAGQRYAFEATTNFSSWIPLTTNIMPGGALLTWIDPDSTNYNYRFYRARFVP